MKTIEEIILQTESKMEGNKFFTEIVTNKNEVFKEKPNILDLDWDSIGVLESNCMSIIEILIYNAFFPNQNIASKVEKTKFLKGKSYLSMPLYDLYINSEELYNKHPEAIEHVDLFIWPVNLVYLKIYNLVIKYLTTEGNAIPFDPAKEIKSIFTTRRKYPTTKAKYQNHFRELSEVIINHKSKDPKEGFSQLNTNNKDLIAHLIRIIFNHQIEQFENDLSPIKIKKKLEGLLSIDSTSFMREIKIDQNKIRKKNLFYKDIYNFFVFVIQDADLIKNSEEFEKKDLKAYQNFERYMIAKAKIILGHTK